MLVAALHTRESQDPSKFNRYLHQGDLLGSPCERVPCGKDKTKDDYVPDFAADEWEKAAIHALTMPDKKRHREALGISYATTDLAALATFAEAYNAEFEDMERRVPDLARIQERIGFQPSRSIDQIIDDVIAHVKSER